MTRKPGRIDVGIDRFCIEHDKRCPSGFAQAANRALVKARESAGQLIDEVKLQVGPDGHYLRFMKAIDTRSMSLACHGAPDAIANFVKISLQDNYPHDRAVGYVAGEPHGAVSIKQP